MISISKSKLRAILILILSVTTATVLTWRFTQAIPAPTISCVIEPGAGCGPTDCDYTFYVDGSTYLASKGRGGGNSYSGTSASTVFQNAINAQGAGKFCFGTGSFDFGAGQAVPAGITTNWSQLQAVGLILPAKSVLQCAGYASILTTTTAIPAGPVNDYFAMIVNKDPTIGDGFIIVQNCAITLPAPTQTATGLNAWDDGILCAGCHDSIFENLQINLGDIELYPNTVAVNTPRVLATGTNYNNLILGVTLNSQTANTALYQAVNSTIQNSAINKLWDDGFIIASAGLNNKILTNSIYGQAVVNNKGALTAGIFVQDDGAVCAHPGTSCVSGNIVSGNNVYNVTGHFSGAQSGIYFLYSQNNIVDSNFVHGNAGWGIGVENSNNTMLRENVAYFNLKDGLRIIDSTAATTYQDFIVTNSHFFDNGVNGQGNAGIFLSTSTNMVLKNIIIANNMFYDDLGTTRQANAFRFGYDGTIQNVVIIGNNVVRSPGMFQTGGAGTLANVQVAENQGYNPFGKTGNFVFGARIAPWGSGSTVVANTDYRIDGSNGIYITSSAGTGVSITIRDAATNTLYAPGATLTVPFFVPYNDIVNFGGFSVAPTVSVWFS
jgi:parallel beta-helix repeat protein